MAYVNTDDLLTPPSASELVPCTSAYIYKIVKAGELEAVRIDGVPFVRRSDIPVIRAMLSNTKKKVKR